MNLELLKFPDFPVVSAIEAIMTQLRDVEDVNGSRIYDVVKYGVEFPVTAPTKAVPLTCCVWTDFDRQMMNSFPMHVSRNSCDVSLYINFWDSTGGRANINMIRKQLCIYTLQCLQEQAVYPENPQGMIELPDFWFPKQEIMIDHVTPFKKINEMLVVEAPWYTSRIDFKIECRNTVVA